MDDIIEAAIDLVGSLLEEALKLIKNPKKRKWALTIFYCVFTLAVVGFLGWGSVALLKDGNQTGAVVFGMIALLLFVFFGIGIVRGHKRNWKNKKDD